MRIVSEYQERFETYSGVHRNITRKDGIMNIVLGVLLTLWGSLILYSSLFRKNRSDNYKDNSKIGASGYIEWEFLFKLFNKLPYGMAKSLVVMIGASFIAAGAWIV
ncbi:hypothetical protein [Halobacillus campisalis]